MQKIYDKTPRVIYHSDESYENLLDLDESVFYIKDTWVRLKQITSLSGLVLIVKIYHIT